MDNIITIKCIICGKPFKKHTKPYRGRVGVGFRMTKAKTCSRECSRIFTTKTRNERSKKNYESKIHKNQFVPLEDKPYNHANKNDEYKCECGETFRNLHNYKKHIKECNGKSNN